MYRDTCEQKKEINGQNKNKKQYTDTHRQGWKVYGGKIYRKGDINKQKNNIKT